MAGVLRLGDMSTGHSGFPPRPNISASSDVFVNGIPAHREGDAWAVHCNSTPTCHAGVLTPLPRQVFVNGLILGSIGDPISCGDIAATGSMDVIVG